MDYLNSLLPSRTERVYALVWSFCAGAILPITALLVIAFSWTSVALIVSLCFGVAYAFPKWRRLKNARSEFRSCAEAMSVNVIAPSSKAREEKDS
jgi:hypothetical protein